MDPENMAAASNYVLLCERQQRRAKSSGEEVLGGTAIYHLTGPHLEKTDHTHFFHIPAQN